MAAVLLAGLAAGWAGPVPMVRAQEAQTPAAKTADSKPSDAKPSDAKPSDAKPSDAKPADPGAAGAATSDQATKTAAACEVPEYLQTSESKLDRVAEAVKGPRRLDILVVGSRSSMLSGPDGSGTSYPARLEVALRDKLPGVTVSVATDLQVKRTAAEVAEGLENLAKERKPTLVIWQTGTIDAVRATDPDDFRTAINDGVAGLQNAGTDVLLMNLQYSPRMETMITVAPYLDNMRVGAQEHNVPLFDRFALMRYWNENGLFDLFNTHHGFGLAKRVHECLGQALAAFVIEAAHLGPAPADKVQH
jgi:hypothetical protein